MTQQWIQTAQTSLNSQDFTGAGTDTSPATDQTAIFLSEMWIYNRLQLHADTR